MIIYELLGTENHPVYQELVVSNGNRQYDFLRSIVVASLALDKTFLSHQIIKALNFQAIACLHTNAGEYRPCQVVVGSHTPPEHYRVQALMDDFVDSMNREWQTDPVVLATYALWRVNHIHPFINGNGRTARAVCYFILCLKAGGWLPGTPILPELIRQNRQEYVTALEVAHASFASGSGVDLAPLHTLVTRLLDEQMASAGIPVAAAPAGQPASPPPASLPPAPPIGGPLDA